MLIPFGDILRKYNIDTKGIIHVGAHWAEEHDDYVGYGIKDFVYIEPCKEAMNVMIDKFKHIPDCTGWLRKIANGLYLEGYVFDNIELIKCACGSQEKGMVMYASNDNQGQSNSLLEPHLHLEQHSEIVFNEVEEVAVTLLDNLAIELSKFNILAMDCQGYEGEVLKGATETLKHIDVVYTEINRGETYRGNALVEEIDELLSDFTRVETYWPSPSWTWGDAVYIRKTLL